MITFWGFSMENFDRDKNEVKKLMELFEQKIDEIKNTIDLHKNKVRIRVFGKIDLLTEKVQKKIAEVEKETMNYDNYHINILLAYGGKQEIVDACNNILQDFKDGKIKKIDEETFPQYLYTKDLPDPDLIIRTSGEQRLSGLMPWQSSYSELYFCDKLWPDFSEQDLKLAIEEFQRRKRRFGK
jgi:tritrans,polycis-undecaprenyl-diphosphate synthase [geranylgeranyl-diphosphate specific]